MCVLGAWAVVMTAQQHASVLLRAPVFAQLPAAAAALPLLSSTAGGVMPYASAPQLDSTTCTGLAHVARQAMLRLKLA
jgi:hypothetical protein